MGGFEIARFWVLGLQNLAISFLGLNEAAAAA
jgi:hypothetical protein